jgi:glycosyltransferase involved in cell wall biosynthesis
MSTRIAILAPYPVGEAPSQRFRFEQYLEDLEAHDFQIGYYPFLDIPTWKTLYSQGKFFQKIIGILRAFVKRWLLLPKLRHVDYVFIHREAAHLGPPVFEWIIAKVLRKPIIYDFDDAIWLPNYSAQNALFHRLKAYWKIRFILRWSYKISAGNAYLANFARQYNPNVVLMPTTIDTDNHHAVLCNHSSEKVIIGWTGSHTTMGYLKLLEPVLAELEKRYSFEFRVISNQTPDLHLQSLNFVKWNKKTEIADLAEIHIGVMPLEEDQWAEGKCGFKGLQYMAIGAVSILSPVGVNKQIIQHGVNGFLASTLDEWKETLIELLENQPLRQQVGRAGRQTVIDNYSVQANKEKFRQLFS